MMLSEIWYRLFPLTVHYLFYPFILIIVYSLVSTGNYLFTVVLRSTDWYDRSVFRRQNPHVILPATANEKEEERIREKMFPSFPATSGDTPGWKAGDYAHEPLNSYQELMREGMCDSVEEHVTPKFSAGIVERYISSSSLLNYLMLIPSQLGNGSSDAWCPPQGQVQFLFRCNFKLTQGIPLRPASTT